MNPFLLLQEFVKKFFGPFVHMKEGGSVTYSADRENKVSKILYIYD